MGGEGEVFLAEDGRELPYLPIAAKQFMDRSTAIYGPSKSGKTVTVRAIMKKLAPHIEQAILVSPTEAQNHCYQGTVPSIAIHSRIWLPEAGEDPSAAKKKTDKQGGMRFFEQVWDRQEIATAVYNRANRLEVLEKLFERVATDQTRRGLRKLESYRRRGHDDIRRHHRGGEMEDRLRTFDEKVDELKQAFFKKHIIAHFDDLQAGRRGLTRDEAFSLDRIEFNPRLLLVFDDCAAELTKQIVDSHVFKKLFFQGRWAKITVLIACHTPNDLATGLRKNTYNCLFTALDSAISYFSNSSNGFTTAQRREVTSFLPSVFEATDPKFLKFAYVRDSVQRFFVYRVTYPRAFRFGSEAMWEMEDAAAATDGAIDRSNDFYAAYDIEDEAEADAPSTAGGAGGGVSGGGGDRSEKKKRGHRDRY